MRVVVSLTTIPGREHLLRRALNSIQDQSRIPDAIYLWLPATLFAIKPQGQPFDHIHIESGNDLGPAMKILPVLDRETDADTCIITIDDDIEYPRDLISRLLAVATLLPRHALGFTGWNRLPGHRPEVVHLNEDMPDCAIHQPVQVLEGYRGVLYRREFFDKTIFQHLNALPAFRFHDDILLSGYLACRGIPRTACWYTIDPPPPGSHWKLNGNDIGLHTRAGWLEEAWASWDYWMHYHPGVFGPPPILPLTERWQLDIGLSTRAGFRHHDEDKGSSPHFRHDLRQLPWPWPDESFTELIALELFADGTMPRLNWLTECWRILKPGGILLIGLASEGIGVTADSPPRNWNLIQDQFPGLWRCAWNKQGDKLVGTLLKTLTN